MLQVVLYFVIILALTKPMGTYLDYVFSGRASYLSLLENSLYKLLGVKKDDQQNWKQAAISVLAFSFVSVLVTYIMLRFQGSLPLNPQGYGGQQMPAHLAFNTAVSFMTNTNWQSYSPELTLSSLSNMTALAIHNWASAAVGLTVAVMLIRGLAAKSAQGLGCFWVDTVRGTLYVFLPFCLVGALVYVAAGVPQTFAGTTTVTTIEGAQQALAMGPVASQEVIKQLGTNGGGFFNANSSHPFENPSAFADLFTKILIFLIPAGLTFLFGKMVGNTRQGWAVFAAMSTLFLGGALAGTAAEQTGNPNFAKYGVASSNMEGKE
ncbi:MAG TPA: potassium-transporting ATPase subunit KdpA, partial [Fimbriimonas sp.]|nr:potassium-transporting ATPase subunit KdpA [Fimbriimonas sp.]